MDIFKEYSFQEIFKKYNFKERSKIFEQIGQKEERRKIKNMHF